MTDKLPSKFILPHILMKYDNNQAEINRLLCGCPLCKKYQKGYVHRENV